MNKPKYRYGEPLPASRLQQPASIDGVSWGDERDKIIIEALATAPQPTPAAQPFAPPEPAAQQREWIEVNGRSVIYYPSPTRRPTKHQQHPLGTRTIDAKGNPLTYCHKIAPQTTTATSGHEHKQEATA